MPNQAEINEAQNYLIIPGNWKIAREGVQEHPSSTDILNLFADLLY